MATARRERVDAVRNRQLVLDTAEAVFAEHGVTAGLLDIAARAGVGAGTVYRHFPTKEALYAAVISARLSALLDRIPHLPDDPTGSRLFAFWDLAVQQTRANVALCEAVTATTESLLIDAHVRDRFRAALDELVDHAHGAGLLRETLTSTDVAALLAGAATAEARSHDALANELSTLIAQSLRRDA